MTNQMTANQLYKRSGSQLNFKDWLNREKEKGNVIFQKGITDRINSVLGDKLENPPKEEKVESNKVLGLDKRILMLSAVIVLGAVAYKMYKK